MIKLHLIYYNNTSFSPVKLIFIYILMLDAFDGSCLKHAAWAVLIVTMASFTLQAMCTLPKYYEIGLTMVRLL